LALNVHDSHVRPVKFLRATFASLTLIKKKRFSCNTFSRWTYPFASITCQSIALSAIAVRSPHSYQFPPVQTQNYTVRHNAGLPHFWKSGKSQGKIKWSGKSGKSQGKTHFIEKSQGKTGAGRHFYLKFVISAFFIFFAAPC